MEDCKSFSSLSYHFQISDIFSLSSWLDDNYVSKFFVDDL